MIHTDDIIVNYAWGKKRIFHTFCHSTTLGYAKSQYFDIYRGEITKAWRGGKLICVCYTCRSEVDDKIQVMMALIDMKSKTIQTPGILSTIY